MTYYWFRDPRQKWFLCFYQFDTNTRPLLSDVHQYRIVIAGHWSLCSIVHYCPR